MYVTRHGNSCNNVSGIMDKKKDPSLSVSGVLSIMQCQPEHLKLNMSNIVYVSVCVRTWMTAYLLYGRSCAKLTLIISPYIKEKNNDPGNMPENKRIQEMKFNNLLNFVKWLKQDGIVQPELFTCAVSITLDGRPFLAFDSADVHAAPPPDATLSSYCRKFSDTYAEAKEVAQPPLSFVEKSVPDPEFNPTVPGEYSTDMTSYFKDGLLKFYAWVRDKTTSPIFVVSHNHQMQDSLANFLKNPSMPMDLALFNTPKILESNGWTIKFKCGQTLIPDKFIMGIPSTSLSEVDDKSEFLCSQDQSVYDEIYGSKQSHPQWSDMGSKYVNSFLPSFFKSSDTSSVRTSMRGMGGKKKSHRRKKRRTGRRYSRR